MSSHLSRLVSKGSTPVYFITCNDAQNRTCFYYLISTPEKMRHYDAARHGNFDLNDYGTIIASGFGELPSDEIRAMLREKYAID